MGSLAFESFCEAFSGGCGGFFSSVVLFPLDALKTKAQAGGKGVATIELIRKVWKEEGLMGFMNGFQWRGMQSFCEKFGMFYCYSFISNSYRAYFGVQHIDAISNLAIGYCAEWMHAPLTMPIDCCVCRVITRKQSFFAVAREMILNPKDNNPYAGASVFLVANFKVAIQFLVIEQTKRVWLAFQAAKGGSSLIGAVAGFWIGALSRLISDTIMYPTRRIKVTKQTVKNQVANGEIEPEEGKRITAMGNFSMLFYMYKKGGLSSIYSGLFLELFRGVLSGALMISVKEVLVVSVKIALYQMAGKTVLADALRAQR